MYNKKYFKIISLGCKVNRAEAATIRKKLENKNFTESTTNQAAQVNILFTCTITSKAARRSRQIARRLHKLSLPYTKKIIVTGCDVRINPHLYQSKKFEILDKKYLYKLPEIILKNKTHYFNQIDPITTNSFYPAWEEPGKYRTRGLLKIQDGCNSNCNYCIIPTTRGRSKSLSLAKTISLFKHLANKNASEIVITGIHLGSWGRDFKQKEKIDILIKKLLNAHTLPRIRLSSLEITEINNNLIKILTSNSRLCPHLHIPLQTGDDYLLNTIGRHYSSKDFAKKIKEIHSLSPNICIGTDLIVGLPGEDEKKFNNTYKLIKELPISYIHIFPFSPRPNTKFFKTTNIPSKTTVQKRINLLTKINRKKYLSFLQSQLNKKLEIIVENSKLGRTGNYCLVDLNSNNFKKGEILKIKATSLNIENNKLKLSKPIFL